MSRRKSTIIRAPRDSENPYAMIRRDTLQDGRLTFEARGLMAYLLSKPPDWEIDLVELQHAGNCGRDRVYRILRELEENGYLDREREHVSEEGRKKGQFSTVVYHLREKPHTEKADTPKADTPKADMENPQHTYKENLTKEESGQKGEPIDDREDADEAPEEKPSPSPSLPSEESGPAPEPIDLNLIGAWLESLPTRPRDRAYSTTNLRYQEALLDDGIIAADVREFVAEKHDPTRGDDFWLDKVMPFEHVYRFIEAWKRGRIAKAAAASPPPRPPVHIPPGVKGCATCGGTGMYLGPNNVSVPCPACLAAEAHASEVNHERA